VIEVKRVVTTPGNPMIWSLDPVQWMHDELGIRPREFQKTIMTTQAHRICLVAHRQSGKSYGVSARVVHSLIYRTGNIVLAAPTFKQAERLSRICKKFYQKCTHKPLLLVDNRFFIETDTGSTLSIVSLDQPDNVRGLSGIETCVVDEVAQVTVEGYAALIPSLSAVENSTQILVGTPKGRIGLMWEVFNNSGYEKILLPASKNPEVSKSWCEEERKVLGERLYRQEYEIEFDSPMSSVFDLNLIYQAITPEIRSVVL